MQASPDRIHQLRRARAALPKVAPRSSPPGPPVPLSKKRGREPGESTSPSREDLNVPAPKEHPPPAKRRKGIAGSIVSTAVNAALIGTAVGLTVYRLVTNSWRDRGHGHAGKDRGPPPPYSPPQSHPRPQGSTTCVSSKSQSPLSTLSHHDPYQQSSYQNQNTHVLLSQQVQRGKRATKRRQVANKTRPKVIVIRGPPQYYKTSSPALSPALSGPSSSYAAYPQPQSQVYAGPSHHDVQAEFDFSQIADTGVYVGGGVSMDGMMGTRAPSRLDQVPGAMYDGDGYRSLQDLSEHDISFDYLSPPTSVHAGAESVAEEEPWGEGPSYTSQLSDQSVVEEQMDWIGDKLSALIEEGRRALGREVVVMSESKEDEVDDGLGGWVDENEAGRKGRKRGGSLSSSEAGVPDAGMNMNGRARAGSLKQPAGFPSQSQNQYASLSVARRMPRPSMPVHGHGQGSLSVPNSPQRDTFSVYASGQHHQSLISLGSSSSATAGAAVYHFGSGIGGEWRERDADVDTSFGSASDAVFGGGLSRELKESMERARMKVLRERTRLNG